LKFKKSAILRLILTKKQCFRYSFVYLMPKLLWWMSQSFVDNHKELVASLYKIVGGLGGVMFVGGYVNLIYQIRRDY